MTGRHVIDRDWPGRKAIQRRARLRMWMYPLVGGVAGGLGAATPALLHHGAAHPAQEHHPDRLAGVIAITVLAVMIVGLIVFIIRAQRRPDSFFQAPLTYGLRRAQRRVVFRAIRQGRAPDEPTAAFVAREAADAMCRKMMVAVLIFTIAALCELLAALFGTSAGFRLVNIAGVIVFGGLVGYVWWYRERAERYLDVTEPR